MFIYNYKAPLRRHILISIKQYIFIIYILLFFSHSIFVRHPKTDKTTKKLDVEECRIEFLRDILINKIVSININ